MQSRDVLIELYRRIPTHVHAAVEGLSPRELTTTPEPGSNTVGWLVWHLTRVQDDHIAEILESEQVWTRNDWPSRFGLPANPANTGFGHSRADMEAVRPTDAATLVDYYEAVAARTEALIRGLADDDLNRVIDERWDPPVTLGVRLVSVADDDIQHAGQALYIRGLLLRRRA